MKLIPMQVKYTSNLLKTAAVNSRDLAAIQAIFPDYCERTNSGLSLLRQMPQGHPMKRTHLPEQASRAPQNVAQCCLLPARECLFLRRHQIITEGNRTHWATMSKDWRSPLPQHCLRESQIASGPQRSIHGYGALSHPKHSEFWKQEQIERIRDLDADTLHLAMPFISSNILHDVNSKCLFWHIKPLTAWALDTWRTTSFHMSLPGS